MPPGLDNLKHVVVLMMSNRSFDHMLGALKAQDPRIDGLTGNESNPDPTDVAIKVQPIAQFQGELNPDPDHHFPSVDFQLFGGDSSATRVANMQGFVKSYFNQQRDVKHAQNVMHYFTPDKLPVLTTLAKEFAVFNCWFSSVPGPGRCNRAFAHYGTSFGRVTNDDVTLDGSYKSIFERMIEASPARTSKIYYYDAQSSTSLVSMLKKQPELFATYGQFLADCYKGTLPDYSFVEPNYTNHETEKGVELATDQHPDHHVQAGEIFIALVYNAIRQNPALWKSTALLITYDGHGGIYDHVAPPACTPDGFVAQPNDTGTGQSFRFDRLGARVPAVLVSPWIPKGTVVSGRVFEHASIPATLTNFFLGNYAPRTDRELSADTFLDLLTLNRIRTDAPGFGVPELPHSARVNMSESDEGLEIGVPATGTSEHSPLRPTIAGYRSDMASGEDLLGIMPEVETLCAVVAARDVEPPISIGLFGDWGSGKTFFMQQMQSEFNRNSAAMVQCLALYRQEHLG